MKRLICLFLLLLIAHLSSSDLAWAQANPDFKTQYTLVHYDDEQDVRDFIWKLGGPKFEFVDNPQMSSYRIDKLVDRVQSILDMRPEDLYFNIYLKRGVLRDEKVAYYEYSSGAVFISVDYVSDGVLAHEIAHAVINRYFGSASPSKMQEILAQYVDKHLWSDY